LIYPASKAKCLAASSPHSIVCKEGISVAIWIVVDDEA
jgi:hypothetical protein